MLKSVIDSYFAVRRGAGFDLRFWSRPLYDFARYAAAKRQRFIRAKTAIEWAAKTSSVNQREMRLRKVASLAAFAHASDARHELVPTRVFARSTHRRPTPFIFTREQLEQFLRGAGKLQPQGSLRADTYVTLISLLAATGLRVSEALELRVSDITDDGLVIRKTKFKKSRIVPLHPSAENGLRKYLHRRRWIENEYVFVLNNERRLRYPIVQYTIARLVKQLGFAQPGKPIPTLHSLRHTFAVRALERAPTSKDQMAQHVLALSTYLGHAHYFSTYWYLENTPELLRQISSTTEAAFARGEV